VSGLPPDPGAQFEQLYRATRRDLLAYILRRSDNVEDAADVLAETYLVAWEKLAAIPPGAQARLWLFGVARNRLLKGATRTRSARALTLRLAEELRGALPPDGPIDDERSAALRASLQALPEREREVVLLTAWEGLAPREIAVVTRTPVNLVRVRLHRARGRLKRDLTDREPSSAGRLVSPSRRPAA